MCGPLVTVKTIDILKTGDPLEIQHPKLENTRRGCLNGQISFIPPVKFQRHRIFSSREGEVAK